MIKFGEVVDKDLVERIKDELAKQKINSEASLDNTTGVFSLYVLSEEDYLKALDIYRVFLGVAKPMAPSREWSQIKSLPLGIFTNLILVLCTILFVVTDILENKEVQSLLFISNYDYPLFSEVIRGEFWRLLTPAFLHFGWMHVIFNLMWWKDLGKIVEFKEGRQFLALYTILIAVSSNIFQYMATGFRFGGMSGVIYGLLGYLWMVNKFDDSYEYKLPKNDVVLMLVWFIICLTGLLDIPVANVAHGVGLTSGMLLGVYKSKAGESKQKVLFSILAIVISIITYAITKLST